MAEETGNGAGGTNEGSAGAGNAGASGDANNANTDVAAELAKYKEEALNYKAMYTDNFNELEATKGSAKKAAAEAKIYRQKLAELKKGTAESDNDDVKAAVDSVKKDYDEKFQAINTRNTQLLNSVREKSVNGVIASEALKLGIRSDMIDYVQTKLASFITIDEDTLSPIVVKADGGKDYKGGVDKTIPQLVKEFCEEQTRTFLFPSNPNSGSGGSSGRTATGGKVWTRAAIKELSKNPAEYAKHQAEIRKQAALGLVK